jgi:hypothetical protein
MHYQQTFSVTAKTVRKGTKNRQGKLFVTDTVRDGPSGINSQGKCSFPDGKPSWNNPWRLLPLGESFRVDFFYFRQERLFPSVGMPSGKVETYPVSDITVREGWNLPCRPSPVSKGSNLLSANHNQGNHNFKYR